MNDLIIRTASAEMVLHQADITKLEVDAIVNAANSGLRGGGGVDGAIHRAGGPAIMDECRTVIARIGKLETGKAVATTAGRLKARCVIHTVGPVYRPDRAAEQARQLADCYRSSLAIAAERGMGSVAFPSISTGVYGYPVDDAARVAVDTVRSFLAKPSSVRKVIFCVFSAGDYEVYRKTLTAPCQ